MGGGKQIGVEFRTDKRRASERCPPAPKHLHDSGKKKAQANRGVIKSKPLNEMNLSQPIRAAMPGNVGCVATSETPPHPPPTPTPPLPPPHTPRPRPHPLTVNGRSFSGLGPCVYLGLDLHFELFSERRWRKHSGVDTGCAAKSGLC